MLLFGLLARDFNGVGLLFADVVVPGSTSGYTLAELAAVRQSGLEFQRELINEYTVPELRVEELSDVYYVL